MTRRVETPDEAAARLASAQLTERERADLWARIEASADDAAGRSRTARRAAWLAVAASCCAISAGAILLIVYERRGPAPPVIADACALDARKPRLSLPRECAPAAVQVGGDEWLLRGGATVARTQAGSHVTKGQVRFRVRPRARAQAPFRVRVSHGEVRVIGTVFEVSQQDGRGFVTVSEGVIEFVWNDGTRDRVSAGQTLHWPRRAPQPAEIPAPASADAGTPGRADAGAHPADLERVLERLLQLQSQKRFGEAISLLRGTLTARGLSHLQRERISYELGLALEAGGRSSCPHWLRHVERFGAERHAGPLAERIARCRQP